MLTASVLAQRQGNALGVRGKDRALRNFGRSFPLMGQGLATFLQLEKIHQRVDSLIGQPSVTPIPQQHGNTIVNFASPRTLTGFARCM